MKKKSLYSIYLSAAMLLLGSCKLDYENPNGPVEDQVITTREGLISLAVGVKSYYSTSGLQALITAPGTTSRELKGITTFTNILELEAGGTALPTFNGNVNGLWSSMLRSMGMAERLIKYTPQVISQEVSMQSGLVAFGNLFKAMSIGGLATAFEQFPIQTDLEGKSTFVTRIAGLTAAVKLLDDAVAGLAANPPSTEFNTRVLGSDLVLLDVINAYRARYNMMLGKYPEALAAANAVNLNSRSRFLYTNQNPNPVQQQVFFSANFKPRANFGLPAGFVEAGDGRLAFYLSTPDVVVGGETLKTLKGFFDDIAKSIPIYMPDEVRLLKAEAIIRSGGNLADAVTQINAVRTQAAGDLFDVNANLPPYSGAVTTDALLLEVYKQRSIELFLQGLRLEDSRRFGRPAPPTNVNPVPTTFERNRNFYPYPDQERLTNPNTPADPAI
ncbi:RagB/SusD family nutrient uptake outer membrane protein [Chitinophaga niabensis]|uniref:RagB/SusD family nutrient uptake outer membrane protein n=1 Tax=Chitinophaga niabensis TaxID=536979 RepID=UPI0031BB6E44